MRDASEGDDARRMQVRCEEDVRGMRANDAKSIAKMDWSAATKRAKKKKMNVRRFRRIFRR